MASDRGARSRGVMGEVRRRLQFIDEAGPSGAQPPIPSSPHPIVRTPTRPSNYLQRLRRRQTNLSDDRIDDCLRDLEALDAERQRAHEESDSDPDPEDDDSEKERERDIVVGDDSGDEEYLPPQVRDKRGRERERLDFSGFEPRYGDGEGDRGDMEGFTSVGSGGSDDDDSSDTSDGGGYEGGRGVRGRSRARSRSRARARGRVGGRRHRGRARGEVLQGGGDESSPSRSRSRSPFSPRSVSPHSRSPSPHRARGANEGWSEDPTPPIQHPFTAIPGIQVPLPTTPLGFLQLFITKELLEYLMEETNDYACFMRTELQKTRSYVWNGCTTSDICSYLGLILYFGILPAPNLSFYWRSNHRCVMPGISAVMSKRRFLGMNRYFHAFNRRAIPRGNKDRLILVRTIMEFVQKRFRDLIYPVRELSLDEGLLPYKGALSLKVYNPQKPKKYGIKFYFLAESTSGIILDFSVYTGEHQSLHDIVYGLVGRFKDQGYHLFMDNYYNSVSLAQQLYDDGIHCSGTLRLVRGAPSALKRLSSHPQELARGHLMYRKKGDVFVICWKGARVVPMITTSHQPITEEHQEVRKNRRGGRVQYERVTVQRPTIIGHYSRHMGGVDLVDQLMSYYSFARRSRRWTQKTILYLLQLAIQNAYCIYYCYSRDRKKLSHEQFIEMAANSLLAYDDDDWPYVGVALERAASLPVNERAGHYTIRHGVPAPPQSPAVPPAVAPEEEDVDDPSAGASPDRPASPIASTSAATPPLPPPAAVPRGRTRPRPRQPQARPAVAAPPQAQARPAAAAPPPATPPSAFGASRRVQDPPERLLPGDHSLKLIDDNKQLRCRVCAVSSRRRDTRYECVTCKIPLCKLSASNCHNRYHTLGVYWVAVEGPRGRHARMGVPE